MEVQNRVDQLLAAATRDALADDAGAKLLAAAADRTISPAEAARRITEELLGR